MNVYVNLSVDQKFKDMPCLGVQFSLCSAVHGCHYFHRIVTITIRSSNQSYSAPQCTCISLTTLSAPPSRNKQLVWQPGFRKKHQQWSRHPSMKSPNLHGQNTNLAFFGQIQQPPGPSCDMGPGARWVDPWLCTPQEEAVCIIMSMLRVTSEVGIPKVCIQHCFEERYYKEKKVSLPSK